MEYGAWIERNPAVMAGKPIIKGTRITVELVMRKLAAGYSTAQLLKSYPHLNREQVKACMAFAADMISGEEVFSGK